MNLAEKDAYKLKIEVYDREVIMSNEKICDYELDLKLLVEACKLTQMPVHLKEAYWNKHLKDHYGQIENPYDFEVMLGEKKDLKIEFDGDYFWLSAPPNKRADPESTEPIMIKLDLRVLPKSKAKPSVGLGREEPNNSPYLPPPSGRLAFSLNPFEMFQQLAGKRMTSIVQKLCCVMVCVAILAMIGPDLIS